MKRNLKMALKMENKVVSKIDQTGRFERQWGARVWKNT